MDHPTTDNVNYVPIDERRDIIIDELGRTALHIASEEGNLAEVKILLEKGTDGTMPDYIGKTPLHYATLHGHHEAVKLLLNHNTNFDISDNIFRTPLHFDAEVSECIFAKPDYLRSKLVSFVNAEDKVGKLALSYALDNANLEIITLLIAHGSRIPEDMGDFKLLPLFRGCHHNASLWFLLIKRPKLIAKMKIIVCFEMPLADWNYHTKVMDTVFRKAKFGESVSRYVGSLSEEINRSSLLTDNDHLKCLQYLLKKRPKQVSIEETLISASRQDHIETYMYFVIKRHQRCKKHVKAAIRSDSINILAHLWENHHICPDYWDRNIILHVAVVASKWRAVKYLVGNGTDVNARDIEGRTTLHYAYRYPKDNLARYLIDHGADINAADNDGIIALNSALILPPIHKWTTMPNPSKIGLLKYIFIECGARTGIITEDIFWQTYLNDGVTRKDIDGKSLLHHATELGSKLLMKHLIKVGADVNVRANKGKTPLHYSAKLCDFRSIIAAKCLLKHGAMYTAKDDDNKTAEDYFIQLKGKHLKKNKIMPSVIHKQPRPIACRPSRQDIVASDCGCKQPGLRWPYIRITQGSCF